MNCICVWKNEKKTHERVAVKVGRSADLEHDFLGILLLGSLSNPGSFSAFVIKIANSKIVYQNVEMICENHNCTSPFSIIFS